MKITIETEAPNDPSTLFRVSIREKIVGEHLTAGQTRDLVGELVERVQRGGENSWNNGGDGIDPKDLNASNDE